MLQRNGPAPRYFVGEMMTCIICSQQQRSNPKTESNWRVVILEGVAYYACPKEFPPDSAGALQFEHAYQKVLGHALDLHAKRPGGNHAG